MLADRGIMRLWVWSIMISSKDIGYSGLTGAQGAH